MPEDREDDVLPEEEVDEADEAPTAADDEPAELRDTGDEPPDDAALITAADEPPDDEANATTDAGPPEDVAQPSDATEPEPEPEPETETGTETVTDTETVIGAEIDTGTGAAEAIAAAPPAAILAAGPRTLRRSWAQRAVLAVNSLIIFACFAGAAAVAYSTNTLNDRQIVDIDNPADTANASGGSTPPGQTTPEGGTPPVETFPPADPEAKNYLITGADSRDCIDPDSRFAGGLGAVGGNRSDTIMLMRVDPSTKQAAILSFPRDLWVRMGGKKNKINAAYERDDPQKLIDTIWENFNVGVDHFVQVDFCAFVSVVDALGGVTVPFDYPVRDKETGLDVPESGCYTFEGDHALAYVRSRYLEFFDTDANRWRMDGLSDLSRISRQQDFVRRMLSAALGVGITDPLVAKRLIDTAIDNVVTDRDLTIGKMLELAGVMRDFDPETVQTYQIESRTATQNGQSVQLPLLDGENMQAILAVFRGEAALATAPDQVTSTSAEPDVSTTVTSVASEPADAPTTEAQPSDTVATTHAGPGDTLPVVAPDEITPGAERKGVLPSTEITCG